MSHWDSDICINLVRWVEFHSKLFLRLSDHFVTNLIAKDEQSPTMFIVVECICGHSQQTWTVVFRT